MIALAGVDKFNGNCNHCVKKGRKENNCWSKHPKKCPSGNSKIKYNFCNKIGHKKSDCWSK